MMATTNSQGLRTARATSAKATAGSSGTDADHHAPAMAATANATVCWSLIAARYSHGDQVSDQLELCGTDARYRQQPVN